MRRTLATLLGLAVATTPLAATAAGGERLARPAPPKVVADGQLSPLSLDVTPQGVVWFSQNFAGQLMRVRPGGDPRAVYATRRGAEVGAVSVRGREVTFATTGSSGRTRLMAFRPGAGARPLAVLSRYERNHNPDSEATYGLMGLDEGCEVPPFMRPYAGIVESHPYASLSLPGTRYVADAAANAILAVDEHGVSTLAVLPPQATVVTAEMAAANRLPQCVVGKTFNFEPVPTDVEQGPDGMLYVTTLPGGPEDPSLGARGAVHRIDPATGEVETAVTGLLSPTGVAVADDGDLYVAELFGNRISRVTDGGSEPNTWRRANLPGDVEIEDGRVWATRKVMIGLGRGEQPGGQVVRYPR
jgi:hypothetical protein